MTEDYKISINQWRNKKYAQFLEECAQNKKTVEDIIALGCKMMRKFGLHHHYFGDYSFWQSFSLFATAKHLMHYGLEHLKPPVQKAGNDKLSPDEAAQVLALFERRISERIPVEYITNEATYLGRKFYVNEHVLVPRSLMNTRFQDFLDEVHWENYRVLDLCCGSGCIGITLALMNPKIQVDLADISKDALDVARVNIEKHELVDRVKCVQSDCFDNLQGKYDLIITNPPYVSTKEYHACPDEFLNEPKIALESGKDGLEVIDRILAQAKFHLNTSGLLIAEVGLTASGRIKKKYRHIRFKWFGYRRSDGRELFFKEDSVFLCRWPQLRNIA